MTHCTGQDYDNSDPNNGAGWAQGRFFHGNEVFQASRNIYLGDNTSYNLEVRSGYTQNQNTGEQFMWEGEFTEFANTVTAATSTTATFGTASRSDLTNMEACIVLGAGIGQYRKITDYDAVTHTITVSPAWNVTPDTTSMIDCGHYLVDTAVYHNTLQGKRDYTNRITASCGVEPYGGCLDFIVADNTVSQVRTGIDSWDCADNRCGTWQLEPTFFNLYTGNHISNSTNGLLVMGPWWDRYAATNYPGFGYFGNSFRRNTVNNLVYDRANSTGGMAMSMIATQFAPLGVTWMETVFENNSGSNLYGAFDDSKMHGLVGNTLSYKNNFLLGTQNTSRLP